MYWDTKLEASIGQLSPWRRKRAQVFTDLVSDGDRVLDLGVGDGALLMYMLEHKKIEAFGLDVSPKAVDFCKARGLNVILADINKPISDFLSGQYDYIICSEIIENSLILYPHQAEELFFKFIHFVHRHFINVAFGRA